MPLGAVAASPWARQVRGDWNACSGRIADCHWAARRARTNANTRLPDPRERAQTASMLAAVLPQLRILCCACIGNGVSELTQPGRERLKHRAVAANHRDLHGHPKEQLVIDYRPGGIEQISTVAQKVFLVLERAPNITEPQDHLLELLVCSGLFCKGFARARKCSAADNVARSAAKGAGNAVKPAGQVAEIPIQTKLLANAVVDVGIAVVRHESDRLGAPAKDLAVIGEPEKNPRRT